MPEKLPEERPVSFPSGAEHCDATLYLPDDAGSPAPVVIMAHGFGAERDCGLEPFARHFARAGLAVLSFDYRGFGRSSGEPRYVVDHRRHQEDYRAAIDALGQWPEVDPSRIALWGTSYSGGHVLCVAAGRSDIRAVVSMVPFVDGIASTRIYPPRWQLPAAARGLRDLARAAMGRPPLYVPIASEELCALAGDDCQAGYRALLPAGSEHPGHVAARVFLTLPTYRPVASAPRIAAPVLMQGAENDSLIPITAVRRTAAAIPDCTLSTFPIGHFDGYLGAGFEQLIPQQTAFLIEKLAAA